ncbi:hypothetical protein ATI61_10958 [Archangium gephyra]|uniref:Lipoprotein n=1 Tax=Archangium gephyra TaxID=48 RepID=A0ABX9JV56_9BACT|nr:hypothetical protein [Archangium gephyra]REG27723.1 hypothetical protein ATI61_10958 [Archangium gephyra]
MLASVLLLASQASAQSLDSASSACRTQPALCARVAGEETVVPQAAQRLAEFGASVTATAVVLNEANKTAIERKLTECANMAREKVLRQHMGGRSPTPAECREKKEFGGRVRTRAMFLGEEMHKVALACAELELSALRPGGFSREPRYRYNTDTRQRELISPEKEEALLEEGCYSELRGTIKPDIVIHAGNPLLPLLVYDFKFPCVSSAQIPWCKYKTGPHAGRWQNEVYQEALGVEPREILPWIGVTP